MDIEGNLSAIEHLVTDLPKLAANDKATRGITRYRGSTIYTSEYKEHLDTSDTSLQFLLLAHQQRNP